MSRKLSSCLFGLVLLALPATHAAAQPAPRPVRVNIESTPVGAAVYVDSQTTATLGRTPLRNVQVPRGQHRLIFVLENHETVEMAVNVARARETFRATLQPLSRLVITAGNEGANGGAVIVDGVQRGGLPFDQMLQPGRHQLRVTREGYNTFEQWIDLRPAQALTMPVSLERMAPRTGAISIAGDVQGARITIDGQARGVTPTIVDGLSEGEHTVDVRMDGEGYRPFLQTVRVTAGQTTLVNPQIRVEQAVAGSLRVVCSAPGAQVSIDGEDNAPAPASRDGLAPGEHLVVVTAEGYLPSEQTVVIEAGRQRVLSVTLQPRPQTPGRIIVNVNAEGSTVFIDGQDRGAPPVIVENAPAGTHAIVVRAEGYNEFRQTCSVGPGQNCELNVDLVARQVRLRVASNVANGVLFVDGQEVGPVPFEGLVRIGTHRVEIRAEGYRTHTEQITLDETTQSRDIEATLVSMDELTADERAAAEAERQAAIDRAMMHTALTLPQEMAVLDLSGGWPGLAQVRLGIGMHRYLQVDFGVRSFGVLTELDARFRSGFKPTRVLSLGGEVRAGGGFGPGRTTEAGGETTDHPTNSAHFAIQANVTLHFTQYAALTFNAGVDLYSDRWDFERRDRDMLRANNDRQMAVRFRLGGTLDFVVTNRWNFFVQLEGYLGDDRRVLGDPFGTDLNASDFDLMGNVGFTYKFPTPIGGF